MTLDYLFGKTEKVHCEQKRSIVKEPVKSRIPWQRNPKYDEILRKHYFALGGQNYSRKVLDEIGINSTCIAITKRVRKLGLYKELQIRKAEEFMNKKILSKKQRLILKQWRLFNDLLYADRYYLYRPGVYEIRNSKLNTYYVGYSLNLFNRLYWGYANRKDAFKKDGNSYITRLIKENSIDDFEFRISETFHNFDKMNQFFRDDGSFNSELLKIHWKHRESKIIHKRLDQGINLVNQLENSYANNQ